MTSKRETKLWYVGYLLNAIVGADEQYRVFGALDRIDPPR